MTMSRLVIGLISLLLSKIIEVPRVTSAAVTYYVSPTSESCPQVSEICNSLDDYVLNSNIFFSPNKADVSLIFVNGTHTSSSGKFNMTNLINLTMVGESQNVAIQSVEFNIDVVTLHISSLAFKGIANLRIRSASWGQDLNTVKVVNCKFVENSSLKTIRSSLTLSNCEFLHLNLSPSDNPLTVFDSTVHLGGTKFVGADQTAILAFYSNISFDNTVDFINNTGIGGGALSLFSTRLYFANTANISFINNRALTIGGAIYVKLSEIVRPESTFGMFLCFYQVLPPLESSAFQVFFSNNSAEFGGEDIYGTYLNSSCHVSTNSSFILDPYKHFHFETNSMSSVSSTPDRVCMCDSNGRLQCADLSKIFMTRKAYPGETITIPTVIVGGDFGTKIGTVYIGFLGYNYQSSHRVSQYQKCTDIVYKFKPRNDNSSYGIMHISTSPYDNDQFFQSDFDNRNDVKRAVEQYRKDKILLYALITTPVYINITFLECPPGLSLQTGNNTRSCDCHPELRKDIQCYIVDNNVHFSWSSNAWIGVDTSANVTETNRILYSANCPFDYCGDNNKNIDYMRKSDPDDQCAFNRAGRLCGKCRKNFSLAIGFSHCIPCSSNNYLTLLIFFAAAGFLLMLFISILNLTVSKGMINGLIFYANIVWAYQSIALPQECNSNMVNGGLSFLYIFLAWINLDFGIETCFIQGLNAFWLTWMQYVFPLYIWSIMAIIIVCARHSTKLTKIFGDRAVSILATLFLMSYAKLLQTIIASISFTPLKVFSVDNNATSGPIVWSLDGDYAYCHFPHILLFIAALSTFFFLWLPYTLVLVSIQYLRRNSGKIILLCWVPKFTPVFDAHSQPLKHKHHYWFGTLLIVRGVLLISFTSTYTIYPNVNFTLLMVISSLLLCYSNYHRVYKDKWSKLMRISSCFCSLLWVQVAVLKRRKGVSLHMHQQELEFLDSVD